ncbi:MAG: 50S ribosomal protein L11 methyltransferase [Desulfovibrionaceae bacterium]|nr:50S ribosomal protein L11 methyltransferase [Desulfovibrionaceae bacterium]
MAVLTRLDCILPGTHTTEDADKLLALLALHVSHGWEERSLPTGEFVCTVYSTVPESAQALQDIVVRSLPSASVQVTAEEEKDWAEAWKAFFTPVEGGEHFLVLAPWMTSEREQTKRIPIIIEPKTAFGTGHHETTALCLAAISSMYTEGVIRAGMRFLDLGTGSGILGLACAKLGLSGEGLDIDLPAVENALENRAANAIDPADFVVRLGGVEEASGPYDFIVANILAAPLREMAPAIAALPGGDKRPALVLSGLLEVQADAVEAAYIEQGYAKARRIIRGEWAGLVFIL